MCFALPTASLNSQPPASRLPEHLRVALGGVILLGILSFSLLIETLHRAGADRV
jgi:hypothetical protein